VHQCARTRRAQREAFETHLQKVRDPSFFRCTQRGPASHVLFMSTAFSRVLSRHGGHLLAAFRGNLGAARHPRLFLVLLCSRTSQTIVSMNRMAIAARLKPGAEEHASRLLEQGLSFDPPNTEHGTRLCPAGLFPLSGRVVFVFSGGEVEWSSTKSSTSRMGLWRGRSGRGWSSWRIRRGSRRLSTPGRHED
jgi:hypothetical protein